MEKTAAMTERNARRTAAPQNRTGMNGRPYIREDTSEHPYIRQDRTERPYIRNGASEAPYARQSASERPYVRQDKSESAYTGRFGQTGEPTQTGKSAQTARPAQTGKSARTARPTQTGKITQTVKTEKAGKSAQKRRGGKKRGGFSFIPLILLVLILGGVALGWKCNENYKAFAEMKRVVSKMTFGAGVTVEGVDVSEMTLAQALDYWDRNIEPSQREIAVTLNDGTRVTAAQMGYSSNYESVLTGAWSMGKSGSLMERYANLKRRSQQPADYAVARSYYDPERIAAYVESVAAQIDREAKDAAVTSFDPTSRSYIFSEGTRGYKLDAETMSRDLISALGSGGGSVEMRVDVLEPKVTADQIRGLYGLVTTATTNASSSSSNRLTNIRQAVSFINGTCLQPGETFSFNDTVGRRTVERGFKTAPAYSDGTVTEEVGGGICQVSTTLFNAIAQANLKIVERHPHSLTVSYVDIGKDAAVDWGHKDMRFANNTDAPVYVFGEVTEDKRIRFSIYGRLIPDGMRIVLESKKTGDVKFSTEYQLNFKMASGAEKVVQTGKDGSTAEAYKVLLDANGKEVKRELLCKSTYRGRTRIIEYGA